MVHENKSRRALFDWKPMAISDKNAVVIRALNLVSRRADLLLYIILCLFLLHGKKCGCYDEVVHFLQ